MAAALPLAESTIYGPLNVHPVQNTGGFFLAVLKNKCSFKQQEVKQAFHCKIHTTSLTLFMSTAPCVSPVTRKGEELMPCAAAAHSEN